MRVLVIHNFYQLAGGEDTIFRQEVALLREYGVEVETLTFTNENFEGSFTHKLGAATRTFYNTKSAALTEEVIDRFRPDVVHIHNLFYVLYCYRVYHPSDQAAWRACCHDGT